MGRGNIVMKRIENRTARQVTFSRRREGLFKKANELSVLCGAHIGLIVFSSNDKLFDFCNHQSRMEEIIERYQTAKGRTHIPMNRNQQQPTFNNLTKLKDDIQHLELNMQRYIGHIDFSSMQFQELDEVEKQLEFPVSKVRARKYQLLQQQLDDLQRKQLDDLQRKEQMLKVENGYMANQIEDHEVAILSEEQQPAIRTTDSDIEANPMELQMQQQQYQQAIHQFPFLGEEEHSSIVLQLATATLSPQLYCYQLQQPIQPNLP